MNEELQSTNEELQTINTELRDRSDELNRVNRFFGSILTSLQAGVIVVDQELKVHVWNHGAHELWGLREEEVRNKHLLNLDIGLPVEQLSPNRASSRAERQRSTPTARPTGAGSRSIAGSSSRLCAARTSSLGAAFC